MAHRDDSGPLRLIAVGSVAVAAIATASVLYLLRGIGPGGGTMASAPPATAADDLAAIRAVAERATLAEPIPASAPTRARPQWIWSADGGDETVLVGLLEVERDPHGVARFAVDNRGDLVVNGNAIAHSDDWAAPMEVDLREHLRTGTNEFRIYARNEGGPAGVLGEIVLTDAAGTVVRRVVTDESWHDGAGRPAKVLAPLGGGPWGELAAFGAGEIDRAITVPEGFTCELVATIPRKLGSIVALAARADGTIVGSGQYSGLVEIEPCPPGGDPATTVVRPVPARIGGAQGLVFRGDDLYAVVNERLGGGPGLYRVRDSDGDGSLDAVELLRTIPGDPGEHGPHAVELGPDGMLYVLCGNHNPLPDPERSTIVRRWGEDHLQPRMWDASGHAVGILAPGAWICRTDPDGTEWEVVSIGMRNPYDLAFTPEGELFTYDADMEWDMGTPWYRPTRLAHATSGSEFGWRSGSGKWPEWYPDSLPAACDLGPGSPTGVLAGTDLAFPAPWRDALFLCDWTFGTVHAVFLEPRGSSFVGRRETFLTGKPFPVTDAVVSPKDGAMYLAIGGRNAASAIYRVRSTVPAAARPQPDATRAAERAARRSLERFHREDAPPEGVDAALPRLGDSDRFLRWAARTALEHQPVERWADRALASESRLARLEACVALARVGGSGDRGRLVATLEAFDWDRASVEERRIWLRALALTLIRLGPPDDAERRRLLARLEPRFPSDDAAANRELCDLLVALGSRVVVARAIPLLERPDPTAERFDEELLRRSDGYGPAILRMIAASPQREQLHVAASLRTAREGWTDDLRERYFRWFRRAARTAGGNSFGGFLDRIRLDALSLVPEGRRDRLERLSREEEPIVADAPRPQGPGRQWTLDEVAALAAEPHRGRDFLRGEAMYRAAACSACHRFAAFPGDGAGGPDLTGVGRRFGPRELAEALVEPSRTVSDQYRFLEFELDDGSLVVGRLLAEDGGRLRIAENLLAPHATTEIVAARVVARRPSAVSPMMAGLVDPLSREELADLLAYLQAGGDPRDPAFAP